MKVKDLHFKRQLNQFEQDLGYEEWLRDNTFNPTEEEFNSMEKEFSINPINTLYYQPLQGEWMIPIVQILTIAIAVGTVIKENIED